MGKILIGHVLGFVALSAEGYIYIVNGKKVVKK